MIIRDSQFEYNQAKASGGAIYLEYSDLDLFNCKITDNKATIGGGIRFKGIMPKFIERQTDQ